MAHLHNKTLVVECDITKTCPCNIQEIFSEEKNENFIDKVLKFFNTYLQNIHCGYMLEPYRQGGSNEYPQYMFWIKNKNQRTNGPVNAHLSLLHLPINMFEYYGI